MLKVPLMNASQEEEMFYDQLRNWGQNELAPHALEWDEEEELPAPILSEAEALGLYSLTFKENQDGLDLRFRTALLVVETLAQYEASLALKIALLNGPVAQCWPAELPVSQATWAHGSVQITEEGASGVLHDVPWTESARWVMVPQVDRLYMIDLQSEGVECKAHQDRLGLRCAEWADLILTGAKTQIFPLSSEDRQKAEARLQLGWAAVALGLGTAGAHLGTIYAQERVQFNQPLTQFQAIQWMIADSQTELEAVRLSMYASADLLDENLSTGVRMAAQTRLLASEAGHQSCDRGLQMHGGYGYTQEYHIERLWRNVQRCFPTEGQSGLISTIIQDLTRP
jgi:alkylation response protein AidB-like acyl-CoA dehydrogenase